MHDGGYIGSQNRKREWGQYWPGVTVNELGHGGSRDRLRSPLLNSSLAESWLTTSFFSVQQRISVKEYFVATLGIQNMKRYACDSRLFTGHRDCCEPFAYIDLQSNIAFDLVTRPAIVHEESTRVSTAPNLLVHFLACHDLSRSQWSSDTPLGQICFYV